LVTTFVFWISFGILYYSYIGYGLLLFLLVKAKQLFGKKQAIAGDVEWPEITLVVAAFNEEDCIGEKLTNSFALQYPAGKLRFIFISDGSTDRTAAILDAQPGITHLHNRERAGKTAALNRAMAAVQTPLVVFSDANALLDPASLQWMAPHFRDPKVGAVSGEKKVNAGRNSSTTGRGEGLYWKYESTLKKWDSDLNTVVGAAGELFAIRTPLYEPLPEDLLLDDFFISLNLCKRGWRVVYEPRAFSIELPSASIQEERKRKQRISAGGFQAMVRLWPLLIPIPHPVLSFQYVSHRVLRWTLCPACLIALLISNILLVEWGAKPLYQWFLAGQVLFYGLALLGALLGEKGRKYPLVQFPYYFVTVNVSVIQGFMRYLRGGQSVNWEKSTREKSI